MSGSISSGGGGRGRESQDFELNLASIIDCFTVLIAFMLASASFLSIGILDAGVAAAGTQAASAEGPPPVAVTVELGLNQVFAVKLSGQVTSTKSLAANKAGARDYEGLVAELGAIRAKWPQVKALTLTAHEDVEYRDVVKSMDAVRKSVPVVLLGGF